MSDHIARAYMIYAERVLPQHAGKVQKQETRRAFYAGAHAMLLALLNNVSNEEHETNADAALLPDLQAEINKHVADVLAGRA
jgi:hypothetical protein